MAQNFRCVDETTAVDAEDGVPGSLDFCDIWSDSGDADGAHIDDLEFSVGGGG